MVTPVQADIPAAPARVTRPIVLVGLMGAGKSSIGRVLAERLGLEFVDADSEIEAAAGCTIEEIFARHGEAEFRAGERRVIRRLLDGPVRVIATGGGAFMDNETRARIHEKALSIWLKASLGILVRRVSRRGGRPLLNNQSPRAVLARLMKERDPLYATADITVETGDEPIKSVADRVVAAIEDHLGGGRLTPRPATTGWGGGDEEGAGPGNSPGDGLGGDLGGDLGDDRQPGRNFRPARNRRRRTSTKEDAAPPRAQDR